MGRDFTKISGYLDKLEEDIYPQPQDKGHTSLAVEAIRYFMVNTGGAKSVLDVGCGEGFCENQFLRFGSYYTGIAKSEDVINARRFGHNVFDEDFSFLPYRDGQFDLVFSRHSLEHSPFPLLTLMEWHRVSSKFLALVLPDPSYWTYSGKNHYFVLNEEQWENLFDVSGWKILEKRHKSMIMAIEEDAPDVNIEFWYLLEKK